MPRQLRKIIQGATYHCYTRCHGKRDLLKSGYARRFFIEAVTMCQERYRFDLVAAEIVSNHIHLVIKTVENEETVSRIMQYIKARIAEKYNSCLQMEAKDGVFLVRTALLLPEQGQES